MRVKKFQRKEINDTKKSLVDYLSKLLKKLKQIRKPSVISLNHYVDNVQYHIYHADDVLNNDIFNYYVNEIPRGLNNDAYLERYDETKRVYQFIWKFDFRYNVADITGIESKPHVLKDMHKWASPFSMEAKNGSNNYPNVKSDLAKAIRKTSHSSSYWFKVCHPCFNKKERTYKVEKLDKSIVISLLKSMIYVFKSKQTAAMFTSYPVFD